MKNLFLLLLLLLFVKIGASQSILSVTPNTAQSGGTSTTISVTANNTFWNSGAGIYYIRLTSATDTVYGNVTNLIDNTNLECTFFIQGSTPAGCYDVQTYDLTAGLVSLPCGFTITSGGPSSSIVSITPNSAQAGGVVGPFAVVGYNTFWNSGAGLYYVRLVGFNDTINMSSLNSITDDINVNVSFFIPASATNGCYEVQAYDLSAGIVSLNCGFTITGGTTGIPLNNPLSNLPKIYPNPASKTVTIDLSNYLDVKLSLIDMMGRSHINKIYTGGTIVQLDLNNIESGIYQVKIENNGTLLGLKKLIIK